MFHANNNDLTGFAALDGVSFNYDLAVECSPLPPDAGITTTMTTTTTTETTTTGMTTTTTTGTTTSYPAGLCPDGWIESMEGCFLFQHEGDVTVTVYRVTGIFI